MENEIAILNEEDLKSKIYTVRGVQVMLDSDLAEIYGYTTSRFNEQVKNNIERFDEDFMFQLTEEEFRGISNLMSKISTSSWGGTRKLPRAFTEQGVYMLMTVLKGDLAVKQSKALVRIFKQMKDFIVDNYISLKTLLLFRHAKKGVAVTVFNDNANGGLQKAEYDDFEKEYFPVSLKKSLGKFHDRYIVIDWGEDTE